jgi:acyl dehydratase
MRVFKNFDELKAAAGTEVGVSDWVEVSQERIDRFAEATGDNQWIHVDLERARSELPGHTTIAHGLLTVSLAPTFIRSVMSLDGVKTTLNYGANRIRYLAPVPAGSHYAAGFLSARRRTHHTAVCESLIALQLRCRAASAQHASLNSSRSTTREEVADGSRSQA